MSQADGRSMASLLMCMMQILFNETEKLLEKWKHPDPYRPPTAPGGKEDHYPTQAFVLTLSRLEI